MKTRLLLPQFDTSGLIQYYSIRAYSHVDISKRKEEFSLAYARAIAAVAGFGTSVPVPDNDSVDLVLHKQSSDEEPPDDVVASAPQVAMQVKCTARDLMRDDGIHFPLSLKNYNDLRKTVLVPRILVVHCIPTETRDWLQHTEENLLLRHCSYWVSLKGQPQSASTSSVTVIVPTTNKFTPEAVSEIMERIERGEPL
jgi:hypothetical protein